MSGAGEDRKQLALGMYAAFAAGDLETVERILAEDFTFHAPPDPELDRAGYFERCWPNHETIQRFEPVRVIESGDEVVVTYIGTKTDGRRFRNTEVLTFAGDRLRRAEVYFGWDVE